MIVQVEQKYVLRNIRLTYSAFLDLSLNFVPENENHNEIILVENPAEICINHKCPHIHSTAETLKHRVN